MNYQGGIAQALVDEILKVVHKYDETMMLPTALGCLDLVKQQLVLDAQENEDDSP
jgi:hypothetical protein